MSLSEYSKIYSFFTFFQIFHISSVVCFILVTRVDESGVSPGDGPHHDLLEPQVRTHTYTERKYNYNIYYHDMEEWTTPSILSGQAYEAFSL